VRSHLAMFRDLPAPIAHVSSIEGAKSAWLEIRELVADTRVTKGLPRFVIDVVKLLYDDGPDRAISAMRKGDCAFFLCWQMRFDQIDAAIIKRGGTLTNRVPLIRAKFMTQGFLDAAKENLVARGGAWPPAVAPAK
jgi:hypothetical protein